MQKSNKLIFLFFENSECFIRVLIDLSMGYTFKVSVITVGILHIGKF
jgi:hypothetical protein